MKPAFALSLSSDGIELIYRAGDGWRSVALTPFDAGDLPAALAEMREAALRLEPEGVFSKLILPNDQIRYLTVETGDLPADARIDTARQALVGATPYSVDELAFDISADGSITHVAAVALETLDEAETFAVEHGFGPVSFVAVPDGSGFLGEPFFGTTRAIRGTEVEPDSEAVAVAGPLDLPVSAKEPATASEDAAADAAEAADDPAKDEDSTLNTAVLDDPLPDHADQAEQPEPVAPAVAAAQAGPDAVSKPAPAGQDQPLADAPQTGPAAPSAKPSSLPPAPPAANTTTAPAETAEDDKSSASPAPLVAAPKRGAETAAAKPLGAAQPALVLDTATLAAPRPSIPPAPAALRETASEAPGAVQAKPAAEAQENKTVTKGKPRHLGLILTAVLLLFLAAAAVWAVLGEEAFLTSSPEPDQRLAPAPEVNAADGGTAQNSGPNDTPAVLDHPSEEADPQPIAPQVSVLAEQPDAGAADTGADAAESFEEGNPELAGTGAANLHPSVADEAAADGVDLPEEGTDTAFLEPETLQPGNISPPQNTAAEEPLDPLAQAARYAATGVWTVAPDLGQFPAGAGLDELYTASIDRTGSAPDAVALPQPDSFSNDLELAPVASPAAAGKAFDLDGRGLVKASPDGTLNPDGIMIFKGRPKVVPPPAPDRSDPAAEALAEEVARNQVLSRKRPKPRPADLEEQVERAQLGGLSRAELASLRPRKRPASLKPAEEEQLPVTELAVAASVQPRGRPANFANLVDRARRNSQNQVQTAAAVPAAAAAAAPRIPTAASVARRATVNNAINLRKLNLIGVYGTASDRRALVRLPSGRYKKVQVGDRIDGGRVIAIGESQLQYQKGGRNRTLTMPKG